MVRRVMVWSVAAGLVVGTASLAMAANPSIEGAAEVHNRALRVDPPDPPPTTTTTTLAPRFVPDERMYQELATLINRERLSRGMTIIRLEPRVAAAAQVQADDMAAMDRMQHGGSDGSDAGVRLQRVGYTWERWAENIAAGIYDPQTLMDAWMASPAHRANLLGDFGDVGVGAAASERGVPYWSLVVAKAPYVPGGY